MLAFIVESENRPGEIARVCEALAEQDINITSVACVAWGERGAFGLMTTDVPGTRDAFDRAGVTYREIDAVEFRLPDRPGTLADASRKLADAGVNVELLAATGMSGGEVTLVVGVDNVPMAQRALGSAVLAHA